MNRKVDSSMERGIKQVLELSLQWEGGTRAILNSLLVHCRILTQQVFQSFHVFLISEVGVILGGASLRFVVGLKIKQIDHRR